MYLHKEYLMWKCLCTLWDMETDAEKINANETIIPSSDRNRTRQQKNHEHHHSKWLWRFSILAHAQSNKRHPTVDRKITTTVVRFCYTLKDFSMSPSMPASLDCGLWPYGNAETRRKRTQNYIYCRQIKFVMLFCLFLSYFVCAKEGVERKREREWAEVLDTACGSLRSRYR